MRRRIMATAISIAAVPRPSGLEAEILSAVDARQKLQATIESESAKGEAADIEFARGVATDISNSQAVNVDALVQREQAGKTAGERVQQRIEALECLLQRINTRLEQLKAECPEAVSATLTKKIEALEQTLSEQEEAEKDVEEQIKLLRAELHKLPKAQAKKAAS